MEEEKKNKEWWETAILKNTNEKDETLRRDN